MVCREEGKEQYDKVQNEIDIHPPTENNDKQKRSIEKWNS